MSLVVLLGLSGKVGIASLADGFVGHSDHGGLGVKVQLRIVGEDRPDNSRMNAAPKLVN